MRLAVISDVHANRFALEAVLEDIARERAEAILNLGDHLSGPVDPLGTAAMLMGLDQVPISGNHERMLFDEAGWDDSPVDAFAGQLLGEAHRAWVEALPATRVFEGEVFLCHGTPRSDTTNWLDNWWNDRKTKLPDEAWVAGQAEGFEFPLLLCGHTHMARSVKLRDGRLIVNPGAVGVQTVHGSPDARYAIVEKRGGGWSVALKSVPYDHDGAARAAAQNGFGHWDDALRSGWANPDGLF